MNKDLYQTILSELENHIIEGVPKRRDEIHPNYDGYSIANLPASILGWLGVPPALENPLAAGIHEYFQPAYQHIIFLLVDGLRLEFFRRFYRETVDQSLHKEWKTIFERGLFLPLTSLAPSTTSTALTTFWTGRLPAEHGIVGYELFLKEFGLTANMIFHSVASFMDDTGSVYRAGFDPETFLPVTTIGARLREYGVKPFAFQHESISSSGLSRMLLKNATSIPYESSQDLWESVGKAHNENRGHKTYSYIYWSGLDTFSHLNGPDSPQLYEEWMQFAKPLAGFLNEINARGNSDTLFILTADHGQIATDILDNFDLHNHPDFLQDLVLKPTGESRLPYLFIKSGYEEETANYLQTHWDGRFAMQQSDEMLAAGFFGPAIPHSSTLDRIGSHIVFPSENAYWWWVNKENHLRGRHGGISRDEMLVPFFSLEL